MADTISYLSNNLGVEQLERRNGSEETARNFSVSLGITEEINPESYFSSEFAKQAFPFDTVWAPA